MDLRPGRGALIYGGKFVLGLGGTYTQVGCTYSLERFCPLWRCTIDHISGLLPLTSSLHTGAIVVLLYFSYQLGWL